LKEKVRKPSDKKVKNLKRIELNCIKEKKTHSHREDYKQPLRIEVLLDNSKEILLIHSHDNLQEVVDSFAEKNSTLSNNKHIELTKQIKDKLQTYIRTQLTLL
jgi:hypothetical protein